ncbi:hypothetical protein O6H91_01G041000 [Diphasiastrum complanatum]|uniref:Uncharacterized protein n=1 Tax=Diphasiastrum complanatum TaxID=34168 RepID=A0ACC2EQC1_DIPCM|nr:hypothetical protein O6H91_01G041000 [Diphasiastrum complanatum]
MFRQAAMSKMRLQEYFTFVFWGWSASLLHGNQRTSGFINADGRFPSLESVEHARLESTVVIADLEGTLLRSSSSFSYYMLVALEAGSALRALLLLTVVPITWLLHYAFSEEASLRVLVFVTFAGLKARPVKTVAQGVLPRFCLEDMSLHPFKVFTSCSKKYAITSMPRIMIEPFVKEYLNVEQVLGTELQVTENGVYTGFVKQPGIIVGKNKVKAMKENFGGDYPDICLGDGKNDYQFLALCKKSYLVSANTSVEVVPREQYLKPLIFHDGRLVCRPTPLISLAIFLWLPFGFVLAVIRIAVGILLPMRWAILIEAMLGVALRLRGSLPQKEDQNQGLMFVCSHRSLLDPVFLSFALRRSLTALTYSISRFSEVLSPIKTVRLTRCRHQDSTTIQTLLQGGDLVICPEGTTCREPFLLRFSSLFAELANQIVPVTVNMKISIFHGTTARGWKAMDPLFFFMNPCPIYEVSFLEKLPLELTCSGGKSRHEVANYCQKLLAESLGYECTNLTRRDKYMILAGNDGNVRNN